MNWVYGYEGREMRNEYTIVIEFEDAPTLHTDWKGQEGSSPEDDATLADFMFTEGNYACDCNRSIFLNEEYPDFEELECGDTLKMKSFVMSKKARKNCVEGCGFLAQPDSDMCPMHHARAMKESNDE